MSDPAGAGGQPLSLQLQALARGLLGPFVASDAGPAPRFAAALTCGVAGLLAWAAAASGATALEYLLVLIAYLAGGTRATAVGIRALRERSPDVNFLMVIAAVASLLLGHWGEGALLLFLFSLSDALETYAVARTRAGVRSLMKLRPEVATLITRDGDRSTSVAALRPDDLLRVRPGERFATDGRIETGSGAVDESVVTGEAAPVDKQPGDEIFAGTINVTGALTVRVTRAAGQSTLARIVEMVEHAQEQRISAQRLIERWQTPYVTTVLALTALTILLRWAFSGQIVPAVQMGMILLVAASPCAVVIASPVAVLAAVTRAARLGVLFKGGAVLERFARIDAIAFDKTGTLTRGVPEVTAVEPFDGWSEAAALHAGAAIEKHSEHPLAKAIVRFAAQRQIAPAAAEQFTYTPGAGVSGLVDGVWTGVGRPEFFESASVRVPPGVLARLAGIDGQTRVLLLQASGRGAIFTLADAVRADAAETLTRLREMDVHTLRMLTGDHSGPAERVAQQVGLADFRAGLRPEEKLAEIHRLARDNGGVAMVGDGVNDAPALAAATVGVAMGGAGSDVALETADVVLMRDRLLSLVDALHIARACRLVIQQSLLFAFGMIALLIVLTLLNLLILPVAVLGHEGSTVLVVLNGLRLLRAPRASGPAADGVTAG